MLIKLIQHQAHGIHQTVHIPRTILASLVPSREERFLERLEIAHPFEGKGVGLDVRLVEDENEGKAGFVEDAVFWGEGAASVSEASRVGAGRSQRRASSPERKE
jgi:hypothetical protein